MKKAIMNFSVVRLSALVNKDIRYFVNLILILLMHHKLPVRATDLILYDPFHA